MMNWALTLTLDSAAAGLAQILSLLSKFIEVER